MANKANRPSTWNATRRGKVPQYQYKSIKNIYSSNNSTELYNVYGVVIDSRPVEKSKGSDYFCLLRIVDSTFCQGDGVKVTLFHPDQKQLPEVKQWDIIRLHRVRASHYQGNLSLISAKGWSWVCWKGEVSEEDENDDVEESGQSSAATSTILPEDLKRVMSIRAWISKQGYFSLDVARNASENGIDQSLAEVKSGCFFNLVCQVTGMTKVRKDFVILKVWDGTLPSHRIEPGAYPEGAEVNILANVEDIEDYMVDVSVYDNHVLTIEEEPIELGTFIRFCNLHASPKQPSTGADDDMTTSSSELFLHGGMVFNRGVVTLEPDSEVVVEMKRTMLEILTTQQSEKTESEKSAEKRKSSGSNSSQASPKKRKLVDENSSEYETSVSTSENDEYVTPPLGNGKTLLQKIQQASEVSQDSNALSQQDTLALLESLDGGAKVAPPPTRCDAAVQVCIDPEPMAGDSATCEPPTQSLPAESLTASGDDSPDLRCHQKSATAVMGDNAPLRITNISDLLAADVPLRCSRTFRIRSKVMRCSDANNIVFHFCPVTGLRLPARNDGKKIAIDNNAFQHICTWRRSYYGVDSPSEESLTVQAQDSNDVTHTQWPVVPENGDDCGGVDVDMEMYQCAKDESKWETLKFKSNLSRKRKKNGSRFNILYYKDYDCKANLKLVGKNFHRVVRVCSKDSLVSRDIPSVAFQNGIYYYCSPACINKASVPPLSEEASSFVDGKPLHALGCPVLPIKFHLLFLLEDETDAFEATLKGQSAVSFFNDITPEQYLLDVNGSRKAISDDIATLLSNEGETDEIWAEMIIEKKSRRPLPPNNKPVILYEIVNTRIVL